MGRISTPLRLEPSGLEEHLELQPLDHDVQHGVMKIPHPAIANLYRYMAVA
jgi:hypothetical protein